jgi:hypothetical protein
MSAFLIAVPAVAGDAETTLPNGAALAVSIDDPITSTDFLVPPGDETVAVQVVGTASVGLGDPDATFVYVLDGSGSTGGGSGTGCSPILNCEKQFFVGLNNAAFGGGSVADAGVAVFGAGAVTGDMQAAGGDQLLTTSAADVNTVVNSATTNGGVTQYTAKSSGGGSTNFTAGINAAVTILGASSQGTKVVVMASDGASNSGGAGFNAALANLTATGATAYTVAIGNGTSCTSGSAGTLQQIANATGGTCFQIPDPGNLPAIIPDLISTSLDKLEISVDGGAATQIANADIDPDLPQAGPIAVDYSTTVSGLAPGDHEICVTAYGSDAGGSANVTRCETIHVLKLTIDQDTDTNELGSDNTHTVTVTVEGDPSQVAGYVIGFEVTGQNGGTAGTCDPPDCATDANGQVTFTYTVPIEPDSLGEDAIAATTTIAGEEVTVDVHKLWQDTTPPEAACDPTENPHGNNEPRAPGNGGQGQNQDGFYGLSATDDVWPGDALAIYVTDSGSGTVFGPFPVGTTIKYVEDDEAIPSITPMGGNNASGKGQGNAVDWQIIGNGDAEVTAVDGSGNESDPASCLVPPPPD